MDELLADLRYGLRMLRKSPTSTLVAVLTLALGIGAGTAVFSVVQAVLLRPLPYPDSGELVLLTERSDSFGRMSVSVPNFLDWRQESEAFEDLGAYRYDSYNLTGVDRPVELQGGQVSASVFSLLRGEPQLGRTFHAEEDRVDADPVAVLHHRLWSSRFGADPDIVGRTVRLNDIPYTVVGVMPPGFDFPPFSTRVDLWTPLMPAVEQWKDERGNHPGMYVVGRLDDGVTLDGARADLDTVANALERAHPDTNAGHRVDVRSLHEELVGDERMPLLVLAGAVACVLLIACANVANLLLARATSRRREFALRSAVGAGRGRLIRQVLAESVVLAAVGGLGGLLLAHWGTRLLVALAPSGFSRLDQVAVDGTVLVFSALLSIAVGIAFGLVPALRATGTDTAEVLKEGGRTAVGHGPGRSRGALVVAEVALALTLLVGAGLLMRSLIQMTEADPGLDPRGVLTLQVALPEAEYDGPPEWSDFYRRLVDRIDGLPGVQASGAVLPLPLSMNGWQTSYHVEGTPPPEPGREPMTDYAMVTPGFHRALGIPLIRGRLFDRRDGADAAPVAIVDERFAETWWPGEDPVGKRIRLGGHDSDHPLRRIVGVVGHVKNYGVDRDSRVEAYLPFAQQPVPFATLVVKSDRDPTALSGEVRDVVLDLDPDQPVSNVRTMEEYVADTTASPRLLSLLLAVFSGLAMVLAAVGIYGVMATTVAQRTREIGLRMAMGARRRDVVGLVVRRGMSMVAVGTLLGIAAALIAGRLLESLLYEVSASDPWIFTSVAALLATVALLANLVPALRASRIDPMIALRDE